MTHSFLPSNGKGSFDILLFALRPRKWTLNSRIIWRNPLDLSSRIGRDHGDTARISATSIRLILPCWRLLFFSIVARYWMITPERWTWNMIVSSVFGFPSMEFGPRRSRRFPACGIRDKKRTRTSVQREIERKKIHATCQWWWGTYEIMSCLRVYASSDSNEISYLFYFSICSWLVLLYSFVTRLDSFPASEGQTEYRVIRHTSAVLHRSGRNYAIRC